jgi:hypothetical protein
MFAATQTTAPAPVLALTAPAAWLCLDLETGDAPEEAVSTALEGWKPPSNLKDPEKIEARRLEAMGRIREKAALLDASPILCVAVKTETAALIFDGMTTTASVPGWEEMPCGSERALLLALRSWLDRSTTPETVIIGHNVRNFDLPKLRQAFIRHGLRLPEILKPRLRDEERAEVIDTASLIKAFSMEHRDDFCPSLEAVAATLGIPRPKGVISGADVPRLHRAGEYAAILTYCAVDCACTARAYQLMTSSAPDLM